MFDFKKEKFRDYLNGFLAINFLYLVPRLQEFWIQDKWLAFILCSLGLVAIFSSIKTLSKKGAL